MVPVVSVLQKYRSLNFSSPIWAPDSEEVIFTQMCFPIQKDFRMHSPNIMKAGFCVSNKFEHKYIRDYEKITSKIFLSPKRKLRGEKYRKTRNNTFVRGMRKNKHSVRMVLVIMAHIKFFWAFFCLKDSIWAHYERQKLFHKLFRFRKDI